MNLEDELPSNVELDRKEVARVALWTNQHPERTTQRRQVFSSQQTTKTTVPRKTAVKAAFQAEIRLPPPEKISNLQAEKALKVAPEKAVVKNNNKMNRILMIQLQDDFAKMWFQGEN